MKETEQTVQQIERFFKKIAQKFPADKEAVVMTDIHVRISQYSGEMLAFDDDDQEITRCVVEQWINDKDELFYQNITKTLRTEIEKMHSSMDKLSLLKPYSFVLENDDREHVAELYVVDDDDTIIIGGDLMEGLSKELDDFLDSLFKN